ncbi:hypothetical protein GH714_024293 [Hevea brasiliensis]|uniref:Uncharacterized protein n=1 Tax=Hevea brasiliensis TaxID=3981 RepID=A0A6A6MCV8_HEVBR|nr:hypothetical protein GH714_024293 [Hevea brasiliensis]
MDWNSKENYWDLTDFKREAIPIIDEFHRTSGGEFSIDLKLGRVSSNSNDKSINQRKKPGPGVSKTKFHLQYQRRGHDQEIMELRQRFALLMDAIQTLPIVETTIGVIRFHSLEEFDEGKRSCRKRLDGQTGDEGSLSQTSYRVLEAFCPISMFPSTDEIFNLLFTGTHMLPFPSPHVYPTTTVVSPTWSGIVNGEVDASTHFGLQQQMHIPGKQNLFFGSSSSGSNKLGWKQFPFFQVDKPPTSSTPSPPHEAFICQPLLRNKIPLSDSSVAGSYSIFCDRLATITQVQDSNCALSLLSSTQTQTYGNHIVQPNSIP